MMMAKRSQQLIALCPSLIQSQSCSGDEDGIVKRKKLAFELTDTSLTNPHQKWLNGNYTIPVNKKDQHACQNYD
jgi:hypothetical protein